MYKPYNLTALCAELSRDEGRRYKPYVDTEGLLTIGVGHNLDALGLSEEQIDVILQDDIGQAEEALDHIEPKWRLLDQDRQRVLLNMSFNLGQDRLSGFRRMWAAIRAAINSGDREYFVTAANEMLDSKWARQVGIRATRLADRMRELR